MIKNILTSLGPNYEKDDVKLSLKLIFSPESWKDELPVQQLEKQFAQLFGRQYKALAVNSGRSGLYLILKALGVGKTDEVLQQSFTCVAVPNSISWNKARPIYVEIGEDLNIDPNDLESKITKNTKAVIVQHTFGIPAQIENIREIAQKKNITLIEDCAHSLGATFEGKPVGTFSKVSFFSFGRDKTLSSVFGGMILTKDSQLFKKLKSMRDELEAPRNYWIFQQLMHPVLMSIVKPTYNFGIGKFTLGKLLLFVSQKLKILSFPVYEKEKEGERPDVFPAKMPGALAKLALNQLGKLERFVKHRRSISKIYRSKIDKNVFNYPSKMEGESLLRFPVLHKNAKALYERFKKEGILLGNWYDCPVVPCKNGSSVNYKKGCNANTEKLSSQILNLPTYIGLTKKQAIEIAKKLNKWAR